MGDSEDYLLCSIAAASFFNKKENDMSEQTKIYVGSGKVISCDNGLSFLALNLSPTDIATINNWSKDNNGWCKLNIMKRKQPSDKGVTHYAVVDQWKPQKKQPDISAGEVADDSIPF